MGCFATVESCVVASIDEIVRSEDLFKMYGVIYCATVGYLC